MDELSMDNILDQTDIENLFDTDEETNDSSNEENLEHKTEETTDVNPDNLFDENSQESVGGDDVEKQNGLENTASNEKKGDSPKNNFYSSIAKALVEDGIFPDLDTNSVNNIANAEDFAAVLELQIEARLDVKQKRIDEILNAGVNPSIILQYENAISYLDNITTEHLENEDEQGDTLRKQLIYQDFINRGYTQERAQREVKKSFDSGSDIEDAKDALQSAKQYYNSKYQQIIDDAKKAQKAEEENRKQEAENLKKSILDDKKVFGDFEVDKATRQKVFDVISKPIYKDPDTGDYLTAILKYEMENRVDFLKNIGLLFTLTDGFKSLDKLVNDKVKKEYKKGIRELENTLNNTSRNFDGNLNFVSGVKSDPESFIGKGWSLDI